MLDERIKDLLEKVAHIGVYEDNYKVYTSSVTNIITEAQAILDEDENEEIFMAFKYIITNEKYLEELEDILKENNKLRFVSRYSFFDNCAKFINKYWDDMPTLMKKVKNILLIVEDATEEEINCKSLKDLTTESAKTKIRLEEEKENK